MDQEIARLTRVLRQVAHDAGLSLLHPKDPDAVRRCVAQYNRVRTRLGELDATYTTVFGPLPDGARAGDVRIVARALACYAMSCSQADEEPAFLFDKFLTWLCPHRHIIIDFC